MKMKDKIKTLLWNTAQISFFYALTHGALFACLIITENCFNSQMPRVHAGTGLNAEKIIYVVQSSETFGMINTFTYEIIVALILHQLQLVSHKKHQALHTYNFLS